MLLKYFLSSKRKMFQVKATLRFVHWVIKALNSGSSEFDNKLNIRNSEFQCCIFSGNIYCYVITISSLTPQSYYKLQNAQWSEQYSGHNIIPDNHFMCELHVTVKLHRAACSLSNCDSHFFQNQENSSSCSLLNVCITNREQTAQCFWISNEKRSGGFKHMWS
jgi:hypothetical protein